MKKIKTETNDLIILEVDKSSRFFNVWEGYGKTFLDYSIWCGEWCSEQKIISNKEEENIFKIIGKISELNDKDLEIFVESNKIDKFRIRCYFKDYINNHSTPFLKSSKQSFISLLQSNEIDINKELLILEIL